MSLSHLGALVHADPDRARQTILDAIRDQKGNRRSAAAALGTTHRSLYRYIERLRLWDAIDRVIEDGQFATHQGPPRSAERIRDAVLAARGSLRGAARMMDLAPSTLEQRIRDLGLWDDLSRRLQALGHPPLAA